jgi:hypothetical protein
MRFTNTTRRACLLLATLLPLGAGPLAAASPSPLGLADLEGVWASAPGLQAVAERRSVHGVALERVEIAPGHGAELNGRLSFSNGRSQSWRAVREVEASGDSLRFTVGPREKQAPGPKEWVRCRARLARDGSGRPVSITFLDRSLHEGMGDVPLVPVGASLAAHLNRLLLAGTYVDGGGARWEFSDGQQARWPERRFPYEVAVEMPEADCPFISTPDRSQPGGEQRWGYRWDGDTLSLYEIAYDSGEAPIHCAAKPLVRLRRAGTR